MFTGTVTVKTPAWEPDAVNAPKRVDTPVLYADLPCRREDRPSQQIDAWGQLVLVQRSVFYLRDPGPIPNGALLESEGATLRLVDGPDIRRDPEGLDTFIVMTAQQVSP